MGVSSHPISGSSPERPPAFRRLSLRSAFGLLLIAVTAILVHGYHLGVDDAEIYIPGIKRVADPSLFPFGSEFFMSHARLSLFPNLVGGSARLLRLPSDSAILIWHGLSILLLLGAAWRLAGVCFQSARAQWGAVALLAGALSIPVAGTALVIMDPYVTARSLSTPATVFAVACFLSGQPRRAAAWLLFTALVHPQMSVYGAILLACIAAADRFWPVKNTAPAFALALPFVWGFEPATGAAREALLSRTYFFLWNWAWYEWAGVIAPLAILWWFSARPPRRTAPRFPRLAATLVLFGLAFTAAGIVLSVTPRLENYTRLQPMRAFHIIYAIFFILLGGLAGEYLLGNRLWRWFAFFVPLATGMWFLQQSSYPFSPHIELPGSAGQNNWIAAFLWIRGHTPRDAVFALDPNYMTIPEDDQHGFRAVAERSSLADNIKDSGAVSLFPQLAGTWKAQVLAQSPWPPDPRQLAHRYPVTWIVTHRPAPVGLLCPYENQELAVCRIGTK